MKVKEAVTQLDQYLENRLLELHQMARDFQYIDNYAEIARIRELEAVRKELSSIQPSNNNKPRKRA